MGDQMKKPTKGNETGDANVMTMFDKLERARNAMRRSKTGESRVLQAQTPERG